MDSRSWSLFGGQAGGGQAGGGQVDNGVSWARDEMNRQIWG